MPADLQDRKAAQIDVKEFAIAIGKKVGDIDLDAGTIALYDRKGRRTEPRRHVIPLVKEAAALLEARLAAIGDRENVPVFSSDESRRGRHSDANSGRNGSRIGQRHDAPTRLGDQ